MTKLINAMKGVVNLIDQELSTPLVKDRPMSTDERQMFSDLEGKIQEMRGFLQDLSDERIRLEDLKREIDRARAEVIGEQREQAKLHADERIERKARELIAERVKAYEEIVTKLTAENGRLTSEITALRAAKRKLREALERAKEGRK